MSEVDPIVLFSQDVRRPSEPVTEFGPPLEALVARMIASMKHYGGVGLSACQIAVWQRVFIATTGVTGKRHTEIRVFVNPEPLRLSAEKVKDQEGCLSLPGGYNHAGRPVPVQAQVVRAYKATIKFQTLEGEWAEQEYEDYEARCIQHEYDHLEGKFFVDRLSSLQRGMVLKRFEKFVKNGMRKEA